MFLIGKRKCGVGRYRSKGHVYVCCQRGTRKIRRIVVADKSADVLKVFKSHILPGTEMCVDLGTENTYFKDLNSVVTLHEIPGPIHVDVNDPRKNTQTVEASHSGVKMRLRLGRGLHRHNLQAVLDLEDFICNRTNGDPADIFKQLGDASKKYVSTHDEKTIRKSLVGYELPQDDVEPIAGLDMDKIQTLCSVSVFEKSKRYETKNSIIFRTQSSADRNCINCQFKGARYHEQSISWGRDVDHLNEQQDFTLKSIKVYCTFKFF